MIKEFVEKFDRRKCQLEEKYSKNHPDSYEQIVEDVVTLLSDSDYGHQMDPKRIHKIDDGDYQGTLLFVIAAYGYQPSDYWYVMVGYGSCSGCDALQSISDYSSEPPTDAQARDYMGLALNVVQGLRRMSDE